MKRKEKLVWNDSWDRYFPADSGYMKRKKETSCHDSNRNRDTNMEEIKENTRDYYVQRYGDAF